MHIRRDIVEVIHCDFLSMYPTVCTLMRLWDFVIADGVTWSDATADVRQFVESVGPEDFRTKPNWKRLPVLVRVSPDDDVFAVRARYDENSAPNIGLNRLTSDEPLWFTLADVIASKVLTGKAPQILEAVRFAPGEPQAGLKPVTVAGKTLDPYSGDFYRDLIKHRSAVKKLAEQPGADKTRLKAEEQSIKILANSTSYGIFMELNVEDRAKPKATRAYGARPIVMEFDTAIDEKPGRFFHPLLGALITGAARLMLALAERQVLDLGLDWAFCDTDSIAIANTPGLDRVEFAARAYAARDWFGGLNPYDDPAPILKVEKVNFVERDGKEASLEPLYCLAISAKRYVLFNRDAQGEPVIRKASGHGLGHLMDPYKDPAEVTAKWVEEVGAPRWQADLWRELIRATDAGTPDSVPLDHLPGFDQVARSQYAATTPALLSWFDAYNECKSYAEQVKPFNFLLSLQLRSEIDFAADDFESVGARGRREPPRPAAPFSRDPATAARQAFDRRSGAPISEGSLKTLSRSLTRYHLHSEAKFLGGEGDARGILRRRHVKALALQPIGKEANELEERLFIGEDGREVVYPADQLEFAKILDHVEARRGEFGVSQAAVAEKARMSHRTVRDLRGGDGDMQQAMAVLAALNALIAEEKARHAEEADALAVARSLAERLGGAAALARVVGVTRQYMGRILNRARPFPIELQHRIRQVASDLSIEAK